MKRSWIFRDIQEIVSDFSSYSTPYSELLTILFTVSVHKFPGLINTRLIIAEDTKHLPAGASHSEEKIFESFLKHLTVMYADCM